jgi:hypothetical protein
MKPKNLREYLGWAAGVALSPVIAAASWLREGRVAHPSGIVCAADVVPIAGDELAAVARRFAGGAIVRFSGAFWKRLDAPEPLGCALRFRGPRPLIADPSPGDQDLITATPSLYRHDFLRRPYNAIGNFDLDRLHDVALRLMPVDTAPHPGDNRRERLLHAIDTGQATLRLEMRTRKDSDMPWQPLCDIHITGLLLLDQSALGFSPWRTGLGLIPRGALQAARAVIYPTGQAARRLAAST